MEKDSMKKLSYEKWVAAFVQNLAGHLNLAGWRLETEFAAEPKDGSDDCSAHIEVNTPYAFAHLVVFPTVKKAFEKGDIDQLKEIFVHELSHILVDPLHESMVPFLSNTTRPFFNDTLESVNQRITRILLKTLPESLVPPR